MGGLRCSCLCLNNNNNIFWNTLVASSMPTTFLKIPVAGEVPILFVLTRTHIRHKVYAQIIAIAGFNFFLAFMRGW